MISTCTEGASNMYDRKVKKIKMSGFRIRMWLQKWFVMKLQGIVEICK